MNATTEKQLRDLAAQHEIDAKVAEEFMAADPRLPFISALIMAGDKRSADAATKMLADGESYHSAQTRVGSYFRLDWSVRAMEAGHVSLDDLLDELPELWRGSDPDDLDPRYLDLWKKAFVRNGRKYVRDGRALPRTKLLTIYRGQDEDAEFGIAWTTNPKIAAKFANGAATRESHRGGVVYYATVARNNVLGFVTGRGENEIIVDPRNVKPMFAYTPKAHDEDTGN
jgi:hypothetical protein